MLLHTYRDEHGNFKEEIVSRESWREWFKFEVKGRFDDELKKLLGWQLRFYHKVPAWDRQIDVYWAWPLALYPITALAWWGLGRHCRVKGWLNEKRLPEPGTKPHWFWPIYFLP